MPQFMMLLMEDHPMQREIFVELLKGEGFEVVQCTTAEAAELVIAISGLEFRAVVADQNLDGDMLGPADCGARGMIGGSATAPAPAVARSASPLHPPCWQRDTSCRGRAALWACAADALDHVPGKQEDGNPDDAGSAHLDWFVFSHSHGSVSSRD
jgi:hypothetical protein